MTNSLRDRIAAVLLPDLEYAAAYNPTTESPEDRASALADAVIAALGLREERRNFDTLFANRNEPQHRYVTEWENDE